MALFARPDYQVSYESKDKAFVGDVLFIHGNLGSNRWWYPTVEKLEVKAKQSGESLQGRLVLAEMRGHGASPMLPADKPVQVEEIVNDMVALAEGLGLKKALLVGHSAGGLISSLMMSLRPDLFCGAVLIDPVGPKGISFPDEILEKYFQMANDRDLAAQIIGLTIHGNDFGSQFFKDVIVEDTVRALRNVGTKTLLALRDYDSVKKIKVDQPVLIFHGAHDWVLEEHHAKGLQGLMPNSEFVKLADHGHCLNMENPDKLAHCVWDFYKKNWN